jgi:hypothetical protein
MMLAQDIRRLAHTGNGSPDFSAISSNECLPSDKLSTQSIASSLLVA